MTSKQIQSITLALVFLLASGCASTGQTSHEINVTATGSVSVIPDMAYISIGVHTENEDASQAVSTNSRTLENIATALKNAGVAAEDIVTTNFNLWTMDQWSPDGQRIGARYVVDNTVYVTIRSLDGMSQLLGAAIDAGANTIYSIQFDVSDKTAMLEQAKVQAIENARAQAQSLAGAAGLELGEVQSITSYSTGNPIPYAPGGYGYGGGGGGGSGIVSVPISSGQMVLAVDVNVVFAAK